MIISRQNGMEGGRVFSDEGEAPLATNKCIMMISIETMT